MGKPNGAAPAAKGATNAAAGKAKPSGAAAPAPGKAAKRKFARKRSKPAAAKKEAQPVAAQPVVAPKVKDAMLGDVSIRPSTTSVVQTNKQKCLVLGSRNMTAKDRHLLQDLKDLLPHTREHQKLPNRDNIGSNLTELCALHHCNTCMFVEARKNDTAFLWLTQLPAGPSVKLQMFNVHTSDELRMAGNCLKFSRALLHFDREFDTIPHLRILKSLLHSVFNTPRYHPRSKPFIDHMYAFFYLDDRIWFRHYQLCAPAASCPKPGEVASGASTKTELSQLHLMEIGPRFVMLPLTVLNGAFQGSVLYKNPLGSAPTEQRRERKLRALQKSKENAFVEKKSSRHKESNPAAPDDPLDLVFQ